MYHGHKMGLSRFKSGTPTLLSLLLRLLQSPINARQKIIHKGTSGMMPSHRLPNYLVPKLVSPAYCPMEPMTPLLDQHKILTGYDTASNLTSEYADADEFWNDLASANESTPVIFNTVSSAELGITIPLLGDSHDYAVFNGTVKHDGSKTIWARNSWGSTDEFKLEDVYNNTFQIIHLKNWDKLEWTSDLWSSNFAVSNDGQ